MDVGFNAAGSTIDRLLILAVAIRRSARRIHTLRQGPNDQQVEFHCYLVVKARYPNARKSLHNQLGASIYVRGTSLLYLKTHNEKLASKRGDQSGIQDATNEDSAPENNSQNPNNWVDRPITDKKPRVSGPETLPSALSPTVLSRLPKTKNKPSGSIVSRGRTVRDGQSENFYYPPMPENDKRYQPCNLCADPLEVANLTRKSWECVFPFSLGYRANLG